ncbi:hypothetical protein NKG94_04455 [Micromonospora sp. M12]
MLSTATMARLGKVYGNLMVDMNATNEKLVDRARRIVAEAADTDLDSAARALAAAHGHAKTAIVLLLANCTAEEAAARLRDADDDVRRPSRPDRSRQGTGTGPAARTLSGRSPRVRRMYFVCRWREESPFSKRVVTLPDATMLDWFRRGWGRANPQGWIESELGDDVYGLDSIFEEAGSGTCRRRRPSTSYASC